ncbi:tyrosine-protein phosphatase non-receptor type 4 [Caerostris darwini]|uniref:Tyrosine-protein phosphatase non-receptor type 4 n=2 Tax=Caerostris TaxID=172845 RepID=A0AAV4NEP2_9ARAC|nr:tyrosine-protein phosphatase non-receptor type 4 [Caerostris darwini]
MDVIDLWELLSYVDGLSFETYPWDLFYLCHPQANVERNQPEILSKTGDVSQEETEFSETQRDEDKEIISFNHVPSAEMPTQYSKFKDDHPTRPEGLRKPTIRQPTLFPQQRKEEREKKIDFIAYNSATKLQNKLEDQVAQTTHSNQTFLTENSNGYQNALEPPDLIESKDQSLDQSSFLIDTSTDIQSSQLLQESMLTLQLSLEDRATFEDLFRRNPHESMNVARLPENAPKNRYKDVLPYDSSRVILKDDTNGDYINASFVRMPLPHPRKPNEYIAAQGPLPQTCNDFWQVIWEQNCCIVVMVTPLKERNRVKCHQYWPDLYESATYNEMQITCFSEITSTTGITRDFLVSHQKLNEERHVIQMQYINWPDHGVPVDCTDFLEFVQQLRDLRRDVGGTVLVHCSAGVGRTGVLILVETALAYMDADEPIYPLELLKTMRNQRVMMVQTAIQYKFICEALLKAYNDRCKRMEEEECEK